MYIGYNKEEASILHFELFSVHNIPSEMKSKLNNDLLNFYTTLNEIEKISACFRINEYSYMHVYKYDKLAFQQHDKVSTF